MVTLDLRQRIEYYLNNYFNPFYCEFENYNIYRFVIALKIGGFPVKRKLLFRFILKESSLMNFVALTCFS